MKCPLCSHSPVKKLTDSFQGYVKGITYPIYSCSLCRIKFVPGELIDNSVYDIIYNVKNLPGYDRYYKYASTIKNKKRPLKYLANKEPTYYPVYKTLKSMKGKRILEVGCGYGYLTYALKKEGHEVLGIDISKNAIEVAKKFFGNLYELTSVEDFRTTKKFDVIVANELIEHLKDPKQFLKDCLEKLNTNGIMIITTPNVDYNPKQIWPTDLPPVHTIIFSKKSFRKLAKELQLAISFTDFSPSITTYENKLFSYILSRKQKNPKPIIDEKGNPLEEKKERSIIQKIPSYIFHLYPLRWICGKIHDIINKEYRGLGVLLTKK